MDYELFLEKYSEAYRIPVAIFHGKDLICKGSRQIQDFNLPMYLRSCLPERLPAVWYTDTPEQLYFGGVTLPEGEEWTLLLGPVLSRPCTRSMASELISRLGRQEKDISTLRHGLDACPKTDMKQLEAMLSLAYACFHGGILPEPERIPFRWAALFPQTDLFIPETAEEEPSFERPDSLLTSYLRYGQVEEMKKYLNEKVFGRIELTNAPPTEISVHQEYILGANIFAAQTAIAAGVPSVLVNELSNHYHEKIRSAANVDEADRIFYKFMVDYTEQVHKIRAAVFASPFASTIHSYIYAHIYEKLSTREVAESLHLNENYICARFKEETGQTVVEYIRNCKIEQARFLLSAGQYRISQVSDLLGFSSQSYFAASFHRVTGMTPTQFLETQEKFLASPCAAN